MRRLDLAILLTFLVSPAFSEPNPGHHLPTGIEQVVRERQPLTCRWRHLMER